MLRPSSLPSDSLRPRRSVTSRAYRDFLSALVVPLPAGAFDTGHPRPIGLLRDDTHRATSRPPAFQGSTGGSPRWRLALPGGVDRLHVAYFGVHRHSPADASMHAAAEALTAIRTVLFGSNAVAFESSEVLAGHDMPGGAVLSVYWTDPALADTQLAALDLKAIYASLGTWRDSVGLWSERFTTSVSTLRTDYRGTDPHLHRHGLARWPRSLLVRDPGVGHRGAEPSPAEAEPQRRARPPAIVPLGYRERLTGTNVDTLMHVRSGHDGSDCGELEAGLRERGLQILIDLGLQHLWRSPAETGTYGLRQLVRVDDDAALLADVGFAGFFRSAQDLDRWLDEHDAHLADFHRMLDQEGLIEPNRRLRGYQEVSTIAPGDATFEYVNCGPRTGVIRFIELERTRLSARPDLG